MSPQTPQMRQIELIEVADGYQLKLIDPYNRPTLYVRRPGSDSEEIHTFDNDDAFFAELSTFIDTATLGTADLPILSSFDDGMLPISGLSR